MTTVAEEREIAMREFDMFMAEHFSILPGIAAMAVLKIVWLEAWSEGAKRGVQLAFKAAEKVAKGD